MTGYIAKHDLAVVNQADNPYPVSHVLDVGGLTDQRQLSFAGLSGL